MKQEDKDFTVTCYYFPNYHADERNKKVHGNDWTEWELVKGARPRFDGHYQPKEPLWGYCDEADPDVMAIKIDAAADHGIDAFIFDWYWYNDGPFLQRCLNEGFLHARNTDKLKFAIMWANHDWYNIHPATPASVKNRKSDGMCGSGRLLYPGKVTEKTFDYITDLVINEYFVRSNYWKINGCPYFSIYDLNLLTRSFGGIEGTRKQLDRFHEKVIKSGFPGLHLNSVVFAKTILPGEVAVPFEIVVDKLGFSSCTSYVWIHHIDMEQFPRINYTSAMHDYFNKWDEIVSKTKVPYYPNITMGWDSSPRTSQSDVFENLGYPYTSIFTENEPARFKDVLRLTKQKMSCNGTGIVTINCWNEWTEGSYLEPDKVYGMRYLEAIRDIFGINSKTSHMDIEEKFIKSRIFKSQLSHSLKEFTLPTLLRRFRST